MPPAPRSSNQGSTTRSRTRKSATATLPQPTMNGHSPTIPSGTRTYALDTYRAESHIDPFVLDTDTERIVIPPPTGETLLTIGETPMTQARTLFMLLCGEQFDRVWEAVRHEPSGVLIALLQDMGSHFMIMGVQAAPGGFGASPNS